MKASTSGTPTGTVTFKDGSVTLGTGTLTGGTATFTTSKLAKMAFDQDFVARGVRGLLGKATLGVAFLSATQSGLRAPSV